MKFELELGPCPSNVDAVQLTDNGDSAEQMRRQCLAWKEQLRRELQKNPEFRDCQVKLRVKGFEHDFGTYYEVVASCDDADERAIEAILWLEENAPSKFDDDISAALAPRCDV